MSIDRSKVLQDADEFERLVSELLEAFPEMERETAERVIIHAGHKEIERLLLAQSELLTDYIKARADNAAQFAGLGSKLAKKKTNE